jgi:hypothetical protein
LYLSHNLSYRIDKSLSATYRVKCKKKERQFSYPCIPAITGAGLSQVLHLTYRLQVTCQNIKALKADNFQGSDLSNEQEWCADKGVGSNSELPAFFKDRNRSTADCLLPIADCLPLTVYHFQSPLLSAAVPARSDQGFWRQGLQRLLMKPTRQYPRISGVTIPW